MPTEAGIPLSDPVTRTWVQIVYMGDDFNKHKWGVVNRDR